VTNITENDLSKIIIDSAFKIHSSLGPGLLEGVYEGCLKHELRKRGLQVDAQVQCPVYYGGEKIELGYRLDLLVENKVILELKCVDRLLPIHEAQLLTYLKLCNKRLGLLLNFNVVLLKNGIKRMVNKL
jgi:GxxExxY protein